MKKNWIYLKRGILTPEHVRKMGVRFWLYLYMLDGVDWPTGIYEGWKDRYAADDLGYPEATIRDQRLRLAADGYITLKQIQHGLRVTIMKWVNPREYSGEVRNLPPVGGIEDEKGSEKPEPSEVQGVTQGVTQGDTATHVPSLSPLTINHRTAAPRPRDLLFDAIAAVCRVDPATAGKSIAKVRSTLAKATPPYTPEEVWAFGANWAKQYGATRSPTIWQLGERIGSVRLAVVAPDPYTDEN